MLRWFGWVWVGLGRKYMVDKAASKLQIVAKHMGPLYDAWNLAFGLPPDEYIVRKSWVNIYPGLFTNALVKISFTQIGRKNYPSSVKSNMQCVYFFTNLVIVFVFHPRVCHEAYIAKKEVYVFLIFSHFIKFLVVLFLTTTLYVLRVFLNNLLLYFFPLSVKCIKPSFMGKAL